MVQVRTDLASVIRARTAKIGVVGLGHVGLPEAVAFAEAGFDVVAHDIDAERVALINRGTSYVHDVDDRALGQLVQQGRLSGVEDIGELAAADVVIIAVPTLLTKHKNPDVSAVHKVAKELIPILKRPVLVILESTGYPGATEQVVKPALERLDRRVDVDFFLACSPSRLDPGNTAWPLRKIPKVVGGLTGRSRDLAALLYRQIVDSVALASSLEAAEVTKLMENSFRTVNIAFVNQMAMICHQMGLDIWEIVQLAATKPFGYMPFYPGPGPGGNCIPVDPFYVAWKAREYGLRARFIELAGEVMDEMPVFFTGRLYDLLNGQGKTLKGAKVLLVGVAYKKDVGNVGGSPAHGVLRLLVERGACVAYHDPHVPRFECDGTVLHSVPLTQELVADQDAVIVLTNHSGVDYGLIARSGHLVLDTRNALAGCAGDHIHH